MSEPSLVPQDSGFWTGVGGFCTALATLLTTRRHVSKHALTNAINPIANRVSLLEAERKEIARRLNTIEENQKSNMDRLEGRLDRIADLLMQRDR